MLPYLATYLLIAFILAAIDRFTDHPIFIRTHSKHFPWKLNYTIRWWGPQEYWAAITLGSVAALHMLIFWHMVGGSIRKDVVHVLFIVICFGSSILSIRHFKLVEKFKIHAWWMTILTALATVGLGLVASAYADSFIINLTRIDAAQLPVAQKSLSMLILVSLWAFIATFIVSLTVVITSIVIALTTPTFIGTIKKNYLTVRQWKHYKPGLSYHRRTRMLFAVFVGSVYTVVIAWNSWEYILKDADDYLQETIIFASFHLHPRDCAIPGRPEKARAALISENRVVVATPEKKGYTFETLPCEMQSKKALRDAALKRLKQDSYF